MQTGRQTTLAGETTLSGVALHGGKASIVHLLPASADMGIVFRVAEGSQSIPAHVSSVVDTQLCTRLGVGAQSIGTVEHLLAAATIVGVDNMSVDVDGDELPILDGSASAYVAALRAAGVCEHDAPRRAIRILKRVELTDGARSIIAEPYQGRLIDISIDYPDAAIGAQRLTLDLDDPAMLERLAGARTFCRLADVEAMRRAGLSLGGSLDNAVVVDGDRILNKDGLRDPLEFALHKTLDLVGDLRLAGAPIIGRIIAVRPGHDLNARFVRRLLDQAGALEGRLVEPPAAATAF